ncbi:keratin, type I cytoskeletal 13-like [Embiotoca jacksoni]|uniref:keratin, type I cytoskeletal 13-like n=1 Tax=Embiotoca jacksoni TaxID=100190 RepID=UPI003703A331
MPVSLALHSSISSARSLSGRTHQRISSVPLHGRAPSVYGGAGGFGTRISQSVFSSGSLSSSGGTAVIGDEKVTMQNLNDRLASYLTKVRLLEEANSKLELQIRSFYDKKTVTHSNDFSAYFATITDLRAQITRRYAEKESVVLQMDNVQLAVEDFKLKHEMELNLRTLAEADVARLRGVRDSLTLTISDLEIQIEVLKEELMYINKNHKEEMSQLRTQASGGVNVEVDSTESTDLTKVLEEMREQYETVVTKSKLDIEKWFQSKVDTLQTQMISSRTEVTTSSTQLSELKKTYQSLEIKHQSVYSEIHCLQVNLEEAKGRYSVQLSQLQMTITMLETELQQLRASLEQQQTDYNLLLDIKMRLEMEIAEYRRLLNGEMLEEKKVVVISKVVKEVKEHKPHIEKRVKVIVEELVDGKVVSSSSDTQVETIQ